MKLYISGGISGIPDYKEQFAQAERELTAAGYEVENPAAYNFPNNTTWETAMKYDIRRMLECGGIALLDGWELSREACCEAGLATDLSMEIKGVQEWIQQPVPADG